MDGSGGGAWRPALAAWRQGRSLKNRVLNALDSPVVVLLYHRVADLPSDPEMLAVAPANFRDQLQWLRQRFPIVRFEEEWSRLKEPAVAVTFDDGYADNLLAALPILEELRVPATFFVSTGHIGSDRWFWWHELEHLLLGEAVLPDRFQLADPRFGRVWGTASPEERKALYASLNALMKRVGPGRREDWLGQLRGWAGRGRSEEGGHRSMTREEVARLAASPWAAIGAHTVSHSALSALGEMEQRQEIFASKAELERMIGTEVTTFSYPFGRKADYDRTSVRLCRDAGFKKAASNFPGQAHRWTDPFQVPRQLVRNWEVETFAARMAGFWA